MVIHRAQGKSIVSPPSHCDDCGTVLRWYDNIPFIGWLLLRGKCRWAAIHPHFGVVDRGPHRPRHRWRDLVGTVPPEAMLQTPLGPGQSRFGPAAVAVGPWRC